MTFSKVDGSETVERELELSSRRPTYGTWPRSESVILDGDIGYLRIAKMDGAVDELREAMEEFVDTKGLIVDVRGNGGGTRELLLALGGYLIGPKEPAVVGNIAQYRLSRRFDEDHLEARYMHRVGWDGWNDRQRKAIESVAAAFKPEWQPVGEFSAWHYLVLDRTGHAAEYFYDLPVVVLSDSGCFSATDIFLGALELLASRDAARRRELGRQRALAILPTAQYRHRGALCIDGVLPTGRQTLRRSRHRGRRGGTPCPRGFFARRRRRSAQGRARAVLRM